MIRFSRDKVLLLHQLLIAETGGAADVRDFGLLESALESAYATFDGQELYPGKEEKGARLGYALISNHAFVDGNLSSTPCAVLCRAAGGESGWRFPRPARRRPAGH